MVTKEEKAERNRRYQNEWYHRNKEKRKKAVVKRMKALREWLESYKDGLSCERCGEDDPVCLEFHHERDKRYNVSDMPNQGLSIDRMLEEIEKCVVLCANCHRKLTRK